MPSAQRSPFSRKRLQAGVDQRLCLGGPTERHLDLGEVDRCSRLPVGVIKMLEQGMGLFKGVLRAQQLVAAQL
ncbi:hypothetical protein [Kitasatospora sp. MAA4]|uniref:hypothetical protein n=1 Tax=Kitasatospora sp. MAA4 TaxID=3035093 RepID=UPI002476D4D4|nr:hypothetical protein [Kitasatospora sp. MAA4]